MKKVRIVDIPSLEPEINFDKIDDIYVEPEKKEYVLNESDKLMIKAMEAKGEITAPWASRNLKIPERTSHGVLSRLVKHNIAKYEFKKVPIKANRKIHMKVYSLVYDGTKRDTNKNRSHKKRTKNKGSRIKRIMGRKVKANRRI